MQEAVHTQVAGQKTAGHKGEAAGPQACRTTAVAERPWPGHNWEDAAPPVGPQEGRSGPAAGHKKMAEVCSGPGRHKQTPAEPQQRLEDRRPTAVVAPGSVHTEKAAGSAERKQLVAGRLDGRLRPPAETAAGRI